MQETISQKAKILTKVEILISVHSPTRKNDPTSSLKEFICFHLRREQSTHYISQTLIWDVKDQPAAEVIFSNEVHIPHTEHTLASFFLLSYVSQKLDINRTF